VAIPSPARVIARNAKSRARTPRSEQELEAQGNGGLERHLEEEEQAEDDDAPAIGRDADEDPLDEGGERLPRLGHPPKFVVVADGGAMGAPARQNTLPPAPAFSAYEEPERLVHTAGIKGKNLAQLGVPPVGIAQEVVGMDLPPAAGRGAVAGLEAGRRRFSEP
jgi:hypothetical protein